MSRKKIVLGTLGVACMELAPLLAQGEAAPSASIDERGARDPQTLGSLAQQAYLKASSPGTGDQLGWSVAISGDTAAVGARFEDSGATGVGGDPADDGASNAGAVVVFVRDGAGWSQQAYLKASNTDPGDRFGAAVALSGDTLVVGAPGEDSLATGVDGDQTSNSGLGAPGAAYVFVREGASWSQQAYLKASNTGLSDAFGQAVAVHGDTVVVGAPEEDGAATGVDGDQASNAALDSGAAYVFVRSGTSWSQQAYLKASNTGIADGFGTSVAVWGDTVVAGAPGEDGAAGGVNGDGSSNSGLDAGAAYVFARAAGVWSQQAYLKASHPDPSDGFGVAVSAWDDTVLVGAPGEDGSTTGVGGDPSGDGALGSGAAFAFVRAGSAWSQQAYLKASNTGAGDGFGTSVAIAQGTALVGAPLEDSAAQGFDNDGSNNLASLAGAAYVFSRRGVLWEPAGYLKASNAQAGDLFGSSVALASGAALVGAWGEDSAAAGVDGDQASNATFNSGAAYAIGLCPRATVVYRNAGSNPASYSASPAVLGETWTAAVDNALVGQASSILFAYDTPGAFPLPGGQTLLCLDFGSGELFTGANLRPASSAGGVDSYAILIPDLPPIEGAVLHTQALQLGSPPFALSNAQDLTLGFFQ